MIGGFRRKRAPAALALLLTLTLAAGAAPAQDLAPLEDRVLRLETALNDLKRLLARQGGQGSGQGSTSGAASSATAPLTTGGGYATRLDQLTSDIRMLTGQVEKVSHTIRQLDDRMTRLVQDVEFRLRRLETNPGVAGAAGAVTTGNAGNGGIIAGAAQPLSSPIETAPLVGLSGGSAPSGAPRSLGTVSQAAIDQIVANSGNAATAGETVVSGNTGAASATGVTGVAGATGNAGAASATDAAKATSVSGSGNASGGASSGVSGGGSVAAVAVVGPVKQQYDSALGLLQDRRYSDATAAFQQFIKDHGDHDMAGNAQYWLGESYYVQSAYNEAASAFLEGYKNYRNSSKAPDNLLKLGMTLAVLGQQDDACNVFAELKDRYPNAQKGIMRRSKQEAAKAGC